MTQDMHKMDEPTKPFRAAMEWVDGEDYWWFVNEYVPDGNGMMRCTTIADQLTETEANKIASRRVGTPVIYGPGTCKVCGKGICLLDDPDGICGKCRIKAAAQRVGYHRHDGSATAYIVRRNMWLDRLEQHGMTWNEADRASYAIVHAKSERIGSELARGHNLLDSWHYFKTAKDPADLTWTPELFLRTRCSYY